MRAGLKALGLAAFVAVASLAMPSGAEAGVPIPCTGDRLIEMPDARLPKGPKGETMKLGYLIRYCGTGQWVAYAGAAGKSYYTLKGEGVQELTRAGVLPAEPSKIGAFFMHPVTFWVEWLWMVIIGFVVIGSTLANYAQKHETREQAV